MIELGPAGIRANISYYTSIEERLQHELLEAQKEREFWQLTLEKVNDQK